MTSVKDSGKSERYIQPDNVEIYYVGKTPKSWKCIYENESMDIMNSEEICSCNGTRYTLTSSIVSEVHMSDFSVCKHLS